MMRHLAVHSGRYLFVVDVPNWAWDFKATEVMNNLPELHIDRVYDTTGTPKFEYNMLETYDSIHFFGWYSIPEAMVTRYGHKLSTTIASTEYKYLNREKIHRVLPYVAIVAVCPALRDMLKRDGLGRKIYDCYNGVNHKEFVPHGRTPEHFTMGWIGKPPSMIDIHGYRIATLVEQKLHGHPEVRFMKMVKNIRNADPHDTLVEYYNNLDVYLHTGRGTGTPNTSFEAAACGKALIGTRTGCLPQLIKDGVNGYLIAEGTDEEKAEAIVSRAVHMAKYREECTAMGRRSREIIEQAWTWEKRAKEWESVFVENAENLFDKYNI